MTGLWALQLRKWAGARQSSLLHSAQPFYGISIRGYFPRERWAEYNAVVT